MFIAVKVKYLIPTNHNGTRLKVSHYGSKSETYGRDFAKSYVDDVEGVATSYVRDKLHYKSCEYLGIDTCGEGEDLVIFSVKP